MKQVLPNPVPRGSSLHLTVPPSFKINSSLLIPNSKHFSSEPPEIVSPLFLPPALSVSIHPPHPFLVNILFILPFLLILVISFYQTSPYSLRPLTPHQSLPPSIHPVISRGSEGEESRQGGKLNQCGLPPFPPVVRRYDLCLHLAFNYQASLQSPSPHPPPHLPTPTGNL